MVKMPMNVCFPSKVFLKCQHISIQFEWNLHQKCLTLNKLLTLIHPILKTVQVHENSVDPDQLASFRSQLIWIITAFDSAGKNLLIAAYRMGRRVAL